MPATLDDARKGSVLTRSNWQSGEHHRLFAGVAWWEPRTVDRSQPTLQRESPVVMSLKSASHTMGLARFSTVLLLKLVCNSAQTPKDPGPKLSTYQLGMRARR